MEEIIFYILSFLIGTVFGSFFTLAVYRIPLHQDITHKRSYCPNCNHKLTFFDMIPILSYIFLGGKCRYCKQKIRIRYLVLEILTGIVFLLFAMSLNISFYPLIEVTKLIYFIFVILYLSGMIIIAGIDKEKHNIQKSVLIFELIIVTLYMVYLYTVDKTNIYRYAIYLILLIIFLILENTYLKKKLENYYTLEILELSMIITIFSGQLVYISSVILTLLAIVIQKLFKNILDRKNKVCKKDKSYYENIPFGFYLICGNLFFLFLLHLKFV